MKRNLIFLLVLILLYLVPSLILKAAYGPSYSMWQGENNWVPDQSSGWVRHGEPSSPMPTEPSINIPIYQQYMPIFLPMFVLILFLFTPLSRLLQDKHTDEVEEEDSDLKEAEL